MCRLYSSRTLHRFKRHISRAFQPHSYYHVHLSTVEKCNIKKCGHSGNERRDLCTTDCESYN